MGREQGNVWSVLAVAAGAFLILVIVPLIVQRNQSKEMATVEAQVHIGDSSSIPGATTKSQAYRWPDSEVPRTAERLRDVTAISIAAMTSVVEGTLSGRVPRDSSELAAHMVQRQLVPADWISQQPAVFQLPRGTIHLRYEPKQLSIEVLSVPEDRKDGPAILIRLPDQENTGIGARYFESLQLDGIIYPAPFAPITEIITCGWQPRLFK